VQQQVEIQDFIEITPSSPVAVGQHGGRAKCLQRLIRLGFPVPQTVALSFHAVRGIASGQMPDADGLLALFGPAPVVSVRPSSEDPDWGGPGAILNIGMNDARHAAMKPAFGQAADALYIRFIQAYAIHVARLDPDMFEIPDAADPVRALLDIYEAETDEPFPQDPARQLEDVLRSMARAWDGTSARLLRQAKGAPAEAGLGLVVQAMALGLGAAESGSGVIQFVDGATGQQQVTGRYLSQSQGRDAVTAGEGVIYLARDPRGPSLEETLPEVFADLCRYGGLCRAQLREEMQIEFTLEAGRLRILDAVRVQRTSRASVRIAVALAGDGVIAPEEAVMRVHPRAMSELLHRQVEDGFFAGEGQAPGVPHVGEPVAVFEHWCQVLQELPGNAAVAPCAVDDNGYHFLFAERCCYVLEALHVLGNVVSEGAFDATVDGEMRRWNQE